MNKKKKNAYQPFAKLPILCFYVLIINFTYVNNFPLLGPYL